VVFRCIPLNRELQDEVKNSRLLSCNDPAWWKFARAFQVYRFAFAEEILAQLLPFYQEKVPDVILYDHDMFVGRILARRLNCAAIQISAHFAQYRKFLVRENGVFRTPEAAFEYSRGLDSFLSTHGITTSDNASHIESLNIHLIPREFQYGDGFFDERFCFVGALLNRPFNQTWVNNSNGRPLILISDMSGLRYAWEHSNSFYRLFIDALSDAECHCILSVGDDFDEHALGSLPENFEINQCASHLEILPHAALSVCHGGMLSTLEALYNGVPVLALPVHPGTEEVSYRTAELGLGIQMLRSNLTVEKARVAVEAILSDTLLRTRVKEIQRVFEKSGGAQLAADRIERFIVARPAVS